MQLEPCPHCLEPSTRLAPATRLGRAAIFAFGVAAAQGCGDNLVVRVPDAGAKAVDAPPDAFVDDGGGVPIYAAAPTPDAGTKQG